MENIQAQSEEEDNDPVAPATGETPAAAAAAAGTDDEEEEGGSSSSSSSSGGGLTDPQERALDALLTHRTQKEAALACGISETTLWRYQRVPEFERRLREARRDSLNHAAIRLQQETSAAVSVLREIMTKEDAPAAARITAARTVLDYSFRAVAMDELQTRVEGLEEFILTRQEEIALDEVFDARRLKEGVH